MNMHAAAPGFLSPPSYIRQNREEQNMGQKEIVPIGAQKQQIKKEKARRCRAF
jgi:hypothetical protein